MPVFSIDEINDALRLDLQNDGGSPVVWTDERMLDVEQKLAQAEDIVRAYLKIEPTAWPPDEVSGKWRAAIVFAFRALFDDKPEWIAGLHAAPPTGPIAGCLHFDRLPTMA